MHRTNTTTFTTFNLPPRREATITFPPDEPGPQNSARVLVEASKGSQWQMPIHWHPSRALGCVSVRCLSGHVRVFLHDNNGGGERPLGPDRTVNFRSGQIIAWTARGATRGGQDCHEAWSAETIVTDSNLYRNVSILPLSFAIPISHASL